LAIPDTTRVICRSGAIAGPVAPGACSMRGTFVLPGLFRMAPAAAIRIDAEASRAFAALSGDHNPLHLEPGIARRLIFGGTVTHGVHVLLAALDRLAVAQARPMSLRRLTAEFSQPIATDDDFTVTAELTGKGRASVIVECGRRAAQKITCEFDEGREDARLPARIEPPLCRNLSFAEASAASGAVPLWLDPGRAAALFPSLCLWLPPRQLAVLLATTRIVGMECPGLNSVFSGLDVSFAAPDAAAEPVLKYRTEKHDARFSLLKVAVSGLGALGILTVRYRPPPVTQLDLAKARSMLQGDEFLRQRALIIGGSRGLGEVTAKLVAAGGGEVWITYHSGAAESDRLAEELAPTGRFRGACSYDVLGEARNDRLAALPWRPTHLYYFATPPIRINANSVWSHEALCRYLNYYSGGLFRLLQDLKAVEADGKEPLAVLYPSTVFIDKPARGFAEYAAAKAAGEVMCRSLAARFPSLRFSCPRLPRMLTDQTNDLGPGSQRPPDPSGIILPLLRDLA